MPRIYLTSAAESPCALDMGMKAAFLMGVGWQGTAPS